MQFSAQDYVHLVSLQMPKTMSEKNEKKPEIISWQTYRKSLTELYSVRDGVKGWIKMVVEPTMLKNGFKAWKNIDIQHDERKPKQIVMEDFKWIIEKSKLIVYFVVIPTRNYSGYYKDLDIYYLEK